MYVLIGVLCVDNWGVIAINILLPAKKKMSNHPYEVLFYQDVGTLNKTNRSYPEVHLYDLFLFSYVENRIK